MTNLTKLQAQVLKFPRATDGKIQFTNAFRKEVCDIVRSGEYKPAVLARALNISAINIYKWVKNTRTVDYDTKGIAVSRMRASDPVAAVQARLDKLETERAKMTAALQLLKELGL